MRKIKVFQTKNSLIFFVSVSFLLITTFNVNPRIYSNGNQVVLSQSKLGSIEADNIFYSNNNEENIFLKNNYAPLYFRNLRTNFGNNVFNSCTYVAMGMLLSYYDTYWNDNIIPENYDKNSAFWNSSSSLPQMDTESPGVLFEPNDYVKDISGEEYLDFINQNKDTYFHLNLIDQGINYLQSNLNANSLDLGVSPNKIPNLFGNYFSLSNNPDIQVQIEYKNEYFAEDFTLEKLKEGKPVLIVVRYGSADEQQYYHTMIACDYDESQNSIYVHTGWRDESTNKTLSHISLDKIVLGESTDNLIYYAVALDFSGTSHRHSNNYRRFVNSDTGVCACTYIAPRNIQIHNNYIDVVPTISWDSIYKDDWYDHDAYEVFYTLQLANDANIIQEEREINYSRTSYTFSSSEWEQLKEKMETQNYRVFVYADYRRICSEGDLGNSLVGIEDYDAKFDLVSPTEYLRMPTIAPDEYNFPDAYSSNEIVAEHNISDFNFTTKRLRTGYIHDEFIVLSPIRRGFNEAYIEYIFDTPIVKLDMKLAHWREYSSEQLDKSNGLAVLQEFKNGNWVTKLDLLSDDTNLTRDRSNPDSFTVEFTEPTSRIRFYAKTNTTPTNDNNKGRICIGDLAFYDVENYMPLSGSELPFIPELWNDFDAMQLNCYNYAINSKLQLDFPVSMDNMSEESLENCLFDMASNYSYSIMSIKKYEQCPEGYYKIALVFDDNGIGSDYHFYRQNADGTWSHKLGRDGVPTILDSDGHIIYDPETCSRDYNKIPTSGPTLSRNYDVFIGFYAVNTSNILGGNRQ